MESNFMEVLGFGLWPSVLGLWIEDGIPKNHQDLSPKTKDRFTFYLLLPAHAMLNDILHLESVGHTKQRRRT